LASNIATSAAGASLASPVAAAAKTLSIMPVELIDVDADVLS